MQHHSHNLILASQSPRRRELLGNAGYSFVVMAPHDDVERQVKAGLPPEELVVESAYLKAKYIAEQLSVIEAGPESVAGAGGAEADIPPNQSASEADRIILAADTVAVCESEIHGKPTSRMDAARMLKSMSGKTHSVMTGVCLWHCHSQRFKTYLETTTLLMDAFPSNELESYLDSGQWQGKAGAFGYQDGLDWIHIQSGLESNVVGLPVERLEDWIVDLLENQ